MKELIEKMLKYAENKQKNIFTREEIIEAIDRKGMHILLKWDILEDQGNNQYKFEV